MIINTEGCTVLSCRPLLYSSGRRITMSAVYACACTHTYACKWAHVEVRDLCGYLPQSFSTLFLNLFFMYVYMCSVWAFALYWEAIDILRLHNTRVTGVFQVRVENRTHGLWQMQQVALATEPSSLSRSPYLLGQSLSVSLKLTD